MKPKIFRCLWFILLLSVSRPALAVDPDHCGICGKALGLAGYTVTDKETRTKMFLCIDCMMCPDECYVCGLPVRANYTKLPDGRFLCARDAKTAILDERKADDLCYETKEALDRLFSRFMNFPTTNVQVSLVDRVDLNAEFEVKGSDFENPDIPGYIHSEPNQYGMDHFISLMSALPRANFQATCAHEYSHAWVFENVALERRKTMSRDALEGFCELVSYLLMDSLHHEHEKQKMLRNAYTRGQIDLFIAAERKYGFNDVLDWMRWGANPKLKAGNLGDIRNVEMPKAVSATNLFFHSSPPPAAPLTLQLKGITSSKDQPLALINNQTFTAGESAKVRVGTSNVLVRCLSIGADSARIQLVDSGQELELRLAAPRK